MIHVTRDQLTERLSQRPSEYLREIEPAIVHHCADGGLDFDDRHPAWLAALAKYRGGAASRLATCRACDEFNGNVCELAFPTGCCSCMWSRFVAGGRCPQGRF